jgi:hypothetical protein
MARTTPRLLFPITGSGGRRGAAILFGSITLGASGAIASASGFFPSAAAGVFGVVKTSAKTGRYTFKTDRTYRTLRVVGVSVVGATDAAFGNTNANAVQVRNSSTTGFDLQLFLASTGADTDGASGYVINYLVQVETYGGKS